MLRGMGDWKWAYGSAFTGGAVGLGQLIAPGTRGLGAAILVAAVLLALAASLRVRAWAAERVGKIRNRARALRKEAWEAWAAWQRQRHPHRQTVSATFPLVIKPRPGEEDRYLPSRRLRTPAVW